MKFNKIGLLTPSVGLLPRRYEWAYDHWLQQQRIHWLPEEIGEISLDIRDWNSKLRDHEKNLVTQVLRFFTQSDMDVQGNYANQLLSVFKPVEIQQMLLANANMETIHVQAYNLLLETLGFPESEHQAFLKYSEMKDKHEYGQQFKATDHRSTLQNIAVFGALTEGVQLFSSFAVLMNFPRHGLLNGLGQIVSYSIRDESLHCDSMTQLFKTYAAESGALTPALKDEITDNAKTIVVMEDRFIDLMFEMGDIEGLSGQELKQYVRYICDWRLVQLGLSKIYDIKEHPLPWLPEMLGCSEHSNFFEVTATAYSKAATLGKWDEVWGEFDNRKTRNKDA